MAIAASFTSTVNAGQADAILQIGSVSGAPGETVMVPVAMETSDLVGGFGFNLDAGGAVINDVIWDGVLFSNGWTGWDSTPAAQPNVGAACIFTQDQAVPGNYHLLTLEFEIPADADSFISITATDMMFSNYGGELGDVEIQSGGVDVQAANPDAILQIGSVNGRPGENILIPIAMETVDLVGLFEFSVDAEGNEVSGVLWDGALFSNGWTGWATTPAVQPSVSAGCIFTEDQVPAGNYHLLSLEFTVPMDAEPGQEITIDAFNMSFANYDFEFGSVQVEAGAVIVTRSPDLNQNGIVGAGDIGMLLSYWGENLLGDLDNDGRSDGNDMGILLSLWGTQG
jgi:hypothetical protein